LLACNPTSLAGEAGWSSHGDPGGMPGIYLLGLPAFARMTRISSQGLCYLGWEWVKERPRAADEFDSLSSH
jgi:hypothetical protein